MKKCILFTLLLVLSFSALGCSETGPTTIKENSSMVIDYQMGYEQSIALLGDGRVFTWGRNDHGQLAKGDMIFSKEPINITPNFELDDGDQITMVRMGHLNGLAVSEKQKIFVWGNNEYGQVLGSSEEYVLMPLEISDLLALDSDEYVRQVEIGAAHFMVLTNTNRLIVWGYNGLGQLGIDISEGDYLDQAREITSIFNLENNDFITKISLGYLFSSVLTDSGKVFTFGANEVSQLGNGYNVATPVPQMISTNLSLSSGEKVVDIDMGYYHGSLITNQGNAYLWGLNSGGQLGIGNQDNQFYPIKLNLSLAEEDKIKTIELGGWHSVAITDQGQYYTWGVRNDGRLGINVEENQSTPIMINESFNLNEGERIEYFSLGSWSSSAISNQGRLFTWGYNKGRLGLGNTISYTLPQNITFD